MNAQSLDITIFAAELAANIGLQRVGKASQKAAGFGQRAAGRARRRIHVHAALISHFSNWVVVLRQFSCTMPANPSA